MSRKIILENYLFEFICYIMIHFIMNINMDNIHYRLIISSIIIDCFI